VFVPVDRADRLGLEGRAAAEVSVIDGSWTTLPLPADALEKSFAPMSWRNGVLELKSSGRVDQTIYLRKRSGSWTAFGSRPAIYSHSAAARVQIQLRQDLNTPASLHAADGKGHDRLLSELNPQLRELELGRVEMVHWKAADGRAWEGLLYYPVHYSSGKRFPLVVQTHGYSRSRFSLIGVEGHPSVFAAQALANRDIAVVQLGLPLRESKPFDWLATPREAPIMVAGIDGIIADLAARGVVDKTKVGISGFSRTGFHVEYAVTHSDFVYAAAIAADNVDNSYVQSVFQDWTLEAEQNNGGEAFGEGLGAWLTEASGFNADRVRTPLRLQVNGGRPSAALTHWEMLTRMRHLQLPVELYIIPRMGQGTHNLQNPKQVLAAAGGAVEWYDFWLNGREDTSPAKADQYERWRQLREQRDAALKVLRRPLLQWQATPVPSK
jgi:hypothetical protein